MTTPPALTRAFIVGCPRSGTTLLQAMLATHPDVLTLPETFYFRHIWGRLWRVRRLGLVSPRAARRALRRTGDDLGRLVAPPRSPFVGAWARTFVRTLDAAGAAAAATTWIEKSPGHLRCVDLIERHVPSVRFVHVVRDGRAVAASFFDAAIRDPERWMGQAAGPGWANRHRGEAELHSAAIAGIIGRWNDDIARTAKCAGRPRHHVVSYERLVADPEAVLRETSAFLGLPWDAAVLHHTTAVERVVGRRQDLQHMEHVLRPLASSPRAGRFAEVFDAEHQNLIQRRLVAGGDPDLALAQPAVTP